MITYNTWHDVRCQLCRGNILRRGQKDVPLNREWYIWHEDAEVIVGHEVMHDVLVAEAATVT